MRKVELGEVAEVFGGYAFKSKDFNETTGVPVIKISNIQDGEVSEKTLKEYLPENYLDDYENYQVMRGDILVALSGATTGKTGVYNLDSKSLLNQRVGLVRAKDGHSNQKYLSYYVSKITDDILNKAQGVAQPNISTKELAKFKIPLPSLTEQKEIVAKLDSAQRLIDIDRQMLAKYDELIQSVFLEMFGDPVRNPKGWEVKKLGKILENKDSERVPVKKSDRKEMAGEYPYYGASGIVDYVDDYLFEGPNLLIGEDGANLLSRSTEIAFIADGKYWVNNHAHVLGSERINLLHYVKYFINNLDLEPYITGSAQPKLNQGNLNKIEVPLPDEQYIEEFERRLNKITTEKTATESLLEKSEEFFSSLVQEAFN